MVCGYTLRSSKMERALVHVVVSFLVLTVAHVVICDDLVYDPTFTPEDFTPYTYDNETELLVTHRAYLDVSIDGVAQQRIIIGLFGSVVPETVRNFLCLAEGKTDVDEDGEESFVGYAGSEFHRIRGAYIQGGAFHTGSSRWGRSCDGSQDFEDENHLIDHIGQGWLSMASVGRNFGSQFIIALRQNSWLNGKDTVFGKVLEGAQTVVAIENTETEDDSYEPVHDVSITASGVLPTEPFTTSKRPVLMARENQAVVTHKVYLNISFDEHPAPVPIVIGLFGDIVPRTVENFLQLAEGRQETGSDGVTRYMGYTGSTFHRLVDGAFIQGGKFDTEQHSYGKAALDEDFRNENFVLDHYGPGWVSMADVGRYYGSQFCITVDDFSRRDGEDTVFGKVLQGMDTVMRVIATPHNSTTYRPYHTTVRITAAGVIPMQEPEVTDLEGVETRSYNPEFTPEHFSSYTYDNDTELLVTHRAYLDVTIDDEEQERIVIGLFGSVVPETVRNFLCLAEGKTEGDRFIGYTGSSFHRIRESYIQGGTFNTGSHRWGSSCDGTRDFEDENHLIDHNGQGWLSMASVGGYFGSQFIIARKENSWLNGRDTVFGKILSGAQTIVQMENIELEEDEATPTRSVQIVGSGVLPTHPFPTSKKPVLIVRDNQAVITHQVALNISFDGHYAPVPIVIGLFGNIVPRTVENFLQLAEGRQETGSDGVTRYVGYTGSTFHRLVDGAFIQGGTFETENHSYGKAAIDEDFEDENHRLEHVGAGWVSMASVGRYFGSQFLISLGRNSNLNRRDTVFGKVVQGMDTVMRVIGTPHDPDTYTTYHTNPTIAEAMVLHTPEPFATDLVPVEPENLDTEVTRMVTFDIMYANRYLGRIVFGLFDKLTPVTAENFACVCRGVEGVGYINSTFHRVIDRFMIQGGGELRDHEDPSQRTQLRSCVGDGGRFRDENFVVKNVGAGWLGMANAGRDTNKAGIYVPTVTTSWLDDRHVIFGKVLTGMDVVKIIEYVPRDEDNRDRPLQDVWVKDCKVIDIPEDKTFVVDKRGKSCDYPIN